MQCNKQKTKKTLHFRHVLNDNTTRAHIAATRRSRITESKNMAGKYVREANGAAAPQRPLRVDSQPSKHDSFSSDDSDEDDSAAQSGRRSYMPPVHAAASSNTVAYCGGPSLQVPSCLAHHLLFPTAFPFSLPPHAPLCELNAWGRQRWHSCNLTAPPLLDTPTADAPALLGSQPTRGGKLRGVGKNGQGG